MIFDQSCPVYRLIKQLRAQFERILQAPTKNKADFIKYLKNEFTVLKMGTNRHNVSSHIILFALLELLYLLLFSTH